MSDNKLPSLQNVQIPEDKKITVLDKDKARPKILYTTVEKEIKEEMTLVKGSIDPIHGIGLESYKTIISEEFKLYDPSLKHTHLWVYAFNNGKYLLQSEQDKSQVIKGEREFDSFLSDYSLSMDGKFYPYNIRFEGFSTAFNAVPIRVDQINNLKVSKSQSYEDEFSVFAFAYGDEKQIKTLPSTIVVQDTDPSNIGGQLNYIWDQSDTLKLNGFHKAHCTIVSFDTAHYDLFYLTPHWWYNDQISRYNAGLGSFFTKDSVLGFEVKKKNPSYKNPLTTIQILNATDYQTNSFGEGYKVTTKKIAGSFLPTSVTIYDGFEPEIDTFDIVVDSREFQIPQDAIDVIAHNQVVDKLNILYTIPQGSQVQVSSNFDTTKTQQYRGVKLADNRLEANKNYTQTLEDIHRVTWTFAPSRTAGIHPEIHVYLSCYPINLAAKSDRFLKIIYNDAPEMLRGPVMLELIGDLERSMQFEAIQADDKNGDPIKGFEVKLTDDMLKDKVVLDFEGQNYSLSKPAYYSPNDKNKLSLKWVGPEPKPASLEYATVAARAWDELGAWSEPRTYHILVK